MTCCNQSEWDNAHDLPDDAPDAICRECGRQYSARDAKQVNGECESCGGILINDE